MDERNSKTIICSVFFLDIVEYSKKSVAGQISLKERFNAFLSTAIKDVPATDRIILDTGDGAAISFLGDVEDALRASLSMRASLLSEDGLADPPLLVRMGVNLGPVRLVKDINGQPNIVGDGINVAQRVMGFAEPGQILVSRSYYDAASRLSQEYAGMFHYQGSKTDKHVREHEVYAIGYPGDLAREYEKVHAESQGWTSALGKLPQLIKSGWAAFIVRVISLYANIQNVFKQGTGKQKAIYVGLIAIPLLSIMLVAKLMFKHSAPPAPASAQVVVADKPATTTKQEEPKHAVRSKIIAPAETKNKVAPKVDTKDKKTIKDTKELKAAKDVKNSTSAKAPEFEKAGGGVVLLNVKPWGEIYLDGKMVNVSPPMTKLTVPSGDHVLEIKNTTFSPYKQKLTIKAGSKISVSHKFAN